jgi:tetratricopeptide (TPR) repeat protein
VTRSELEDELAFLLDSLQDLEREHSAGDISEADYVALGDQYTRRAAEVLRALQRDEPARVSTSDVATPTPTPTPASTPTQTPTQTPTPIPARRRRPSMLVVGSLVVVAAVAITIVVSQTGSRLPGQTPSGSVSLNRSAQLQRTLAQAETLEASGNAAGALRLYLQVLAQDPTQPEALAESGWLEFEAGVRSGDAAVLSRAQDQEQMAERADPGAYAPHLYLGSMLLAEGNAAGAVTEFSRFLADGPPVSEVQVARSIITEAYRKAGRPVPAMPSAPPTTTGGATTQPAR